MSVSSANMLVKQVSKTGGRSFKNNQNSYGPKTDPCGTLVETGNESDKLLSPVTDCDLPLI